MRRNGIHKRTGGRHANGQLELPAFAPVVTIPAIVVPQPDGAFLVRPGKPLVESDAVGTRKAARILGVSQRRIQDLCEEGLMECYRPGGEPSVKDGRRGGNYRIPLKAILERKKDFTGGNGENGGADARSPGEGKKF